MTLLETPKKSSSVVGVIHTTKWKKGGYLGIVTIVDDFGQEYVLLPGSKTNKLRTFAQDRVVVEGIVNFGKNAFPTIKVHAFWLFDEVHPVYYRFGEKLKPIDSHNEEEIGDFSEAGLNSQLDQSYEDIMDNWVSDNITFDVEDWMIHKNRNYSARPKRAS